MNKPAHNYIVVCTVVFSLFICLFSPVNNKVYAAEEVLGEATTFTDSQMNLLIAKPAVVQIANIITGEMTIQASLASTLGAPEIAGMYYEFTIGFGGSGFFVTDDGYLITNGHVAKPDNELVAYYGISQVADLVYWDAIIYSWEYLYGYTPTESEVESYYDEILYSYYNGDYESLVWDLYVTNYKGGDLKMDNVKYHNYVQTGDAVGTEDQVKQQGEAATIIDTLYEGDFDSRDLALLKVDGSNFPTVELGDDSNVNIGSDVYVIGYPAIVEEATGYFTDVEANLEPTITKGIVSAKKELIDGTEAFQTDASISGGNSGGPVLDSDSKVIGVATWTISEYGGAESYNFMISVDNVNSLLDRNNVVPNKGITTEKWEEALEQYSNKCYTFAKEDFEEVKDLYPDNIDVDDFISKCQEAIENGEDECIGDNNIWYIVGGVVCCVVLTFGVVGVIIFVLVIKKKKNKKINIQKKANKK